jgi:hypothetical protein
MKAQIILSYLASELPKYTDLFTTQSAVENVVVSGSTVTVTKTAHGLSSNSIISITGTEIKTLITNIDDSGDDVEMTTGDDHDLTSGTPQTGDAQTVKLTSLVDPSIDGDYTLSYVPNKYKFNIPTFAEPALADVYLNNNRETFNINGVFDNVTVIDEDNFSYELDFTYTTPPLINISSVVLHGRIRLAGGATIERLLKLYNEQSTGELMGFVVLGQNTTSKSREVDTDDALNQGNQNDWNVLYMSPFTFYVVVPSSEKESGLTARDTCEDIRPSLFSALLGKAFDTGFTSGPMSVVYPVEDGVYAYRKAYYVHEFVFNQTAQVNSSDVPYKVVTRAFRELQFDMIDSFGDTGLVKMESIVNLDVDAD